MLRTALRCVNRIEKLVDEDLFLSDLFAALSDFPLAGRAPSPGLNACYFILRCVGSWLAGDTPSEAAAYSHAVTCIDSTLGMDCPPDRHLVSALLLMTIVQIFGTCGSVGGCAAYASLADSLAPYAAGLCPTIRFNATCVAKRALALCHPCDLTWPPAEAPVGETAERLLTAAWFAALAHVSVTGMSAKARATDLVSFISIQTLGEIEIERSHTVSLTMECSLERVLS